MFGVNKKRLHLRGLVGGDSRTVRELGVLTEAFHPGKESSGV